MGSTYLFRLNEGVPSIPGCPYASLETTKFTKNDESAPGLKQFHKHHVPCLTHRRC